MKIGIFFVIFFLLIQFDVEADQLECGYHNDNYQCEVRNVDLSKQKSNEIFTFTGTQEQKRNTTLIWFTGIGRVAHLPLNLAEEFPKLASLSIENSEIPIVKNSLLGPQFSQIEKLALFESQIKFIEDGAFQHLHNLEEISLYQNEIQSLSGGIFENNQKLKWINLWKNNIKKIAPETFRNLNQLTWNDLDGNDCIDKEIGCQYCEKIDHTKLNRELQNCYENHKKSSDLLNEVERKCSETGVGLVFGGNKVGNRLYPWAGAGFYNENFYCGGNLITPRHVLFAAHCLQEKENKQVKEASGSYFYFKDNYDEDDDSAKADVSEFIIHPDWDPQDTHYAADIAIAIFKKPIELSNQIHYVCLNTPSDPIQSFAGRNGSVYGWGLTEELETVTELRDADIKLVDQALCNNNRALRRIMSDTSFCAGARDGKTGPCNGDSGGGMILKVDGLSNIIGIVSASVSRTAMIRGRVEKICNLDDYLVYTDVSKFHNWINQVVHETI